MSIRERSPPGRKSSRYKGPEAGECLVAGETARRPVKLEGSEQGGILEEVREVMAGQGRECIP